MQLTNICNLFNSSQRGQEHRHGRIIGYQLSVLPFTIKLDKNGWCLKEDKCENNCRRTVASETGLRPKIFSEEVFRVLILKWPGAGSKQPWVTLM
jgi:hypothetical protein